MAEIEDNASPNIGELIVAVVVVDSFITAFGFFFRWVLAYGRMVEVRKFAAERICTE